MKRSRSASSGTPSARGAERARRPGPPALLAALVLLALAPSADAAAQSWRSAAVPYVPDAPGELLVGLGGSVADEASGIGLNTTDVFASAFGSWASGPWRVNADLGVGILEAPLERFVQDDVLTYAAEVLYRPRGWDARLVASASGWANTRDLVPRGNEDRGRAGLGLELSMGRWRADVAVRRGYAGVSPDWSLVAGVARTFRP